MGDYHIRSTSSQYKAFYSSNFTLTANHGPTARRITTRRRVRLLPYTLPRLVLVWYHDSPVNAGPLLQGGWPPAC